MGFHEPGDERERERGEATLLLVRIAWLASKKHDIQRGGEVGGGVYSGFQKYRRLWGGKKITSTSGWGMKRDGGEAENVIPRAPRANYVKI